MSRFDLSAPEGMMTNSMKKDCRIWRRNTTGNGYPAHLYLDRPGRLDACNLDTFIAQHAPTVSITVKGRL